MAELIKFRDRVFTIVMIVIVPVTGAFKVALESCNVNRWVQWPLLPEHASSLKT